jgi:hypothetical protein
LFELLKRDAHAGKSANAGIGSKAESTAGFRTSRKPSHKWSGGIAPRSVEHFRSSIPTGLRPPAQGWRASSAYSGLHRKNVFNPNGVVSARLQDGTQPFQGCVPLPTSPQGSSQARNPGLVY